MATGEGVDIGMVALCTPAPRAEKSRPGTGEDAAGTRPLWSQSRCGDRRIDATVSEKRIAIEVYQNLNEWIGRREGEPGGPPPFRERIMVFEEENGPIRE